MSQNLSLKKKILYSLLSFLNLVFRKARAKEVRMNSDAMLDAEDEVRLYEDGWKDRYFRSKFDVSADDHEFRRKVSFRNKKFLTQ